MRNGPSQQTLPKRLSRVENYHRRRTKALTGAPQGEFLRVSSVSVRGPVTFGVENSLESGIEMRRFIHRQILVATVLPIMLIGIAGCSSHRNVVDRESTSSTRKSKITLEELEEMFARMRRETKWDIDGDMLWGYFFTDPDRKKLERIGEQLGREGYRVVDIYEADDRSTLVLHVERVERHTPQTLDARNAELYHRAEQFGLQSYDGMDVGPAKGK